jgi:3-oxoacyl-[acyl-carrier protein] reductase
VPEVVVITGTRKGIGRYLIGHFLEKGCIVAGCSRGEFEEPLPENYSHYAADVADEDAMVAMVRDVEKRFGSITALVNNAGIASMNHMLLTPLATVRRVFETNVLGTFLGMREAAKVMMKARYGRIVNFATVATPLELEGESAYAASKAAVESLTRVAARELAPFNVTVNAVGPTPVMTDLIRAVPQAKMDALIGRQAIHRLGEPRDIANVVDFFVSRESDFVTGQTVYLGGVS